MTRPTPAITLHRDGLRRLASRCLLALLLAPLLWQSLGQAHHVLHAPGLQAPAGHAAVAGVAGLAGHQADDGLCRLLDQLGLGQALTASAWAPPPAAVVAAVVLATGRAGGLACPSAFDARGPPNFR